MIAHTNANIFSTRLNFESLESLTQKVYISPPDSRSGGVGGGGVRITLNCREIDDRFVKSPNGAGCESISGFEPTLEVV
jgi:hypothetical protein